MSGHTKGPWVWTDRVLKGPAKYAGPCDMGGFVNEAGETVCWFGDGENYYPTEGDVPSVADKALIAAAPDLLEALKNVTGWMVALEDAHGEFKGGARQSIADAETAIARATEAQP